MGKLKIFGILIMLGVIVLCYFTLITYSIKMEEAKLDSWAITFIGAWIMDIFFL